jgi:quercetin dioxygenase-like cupin family protein
MTRTLQVGLACTLLFCVLQISSAQEGPPAPENRSAFRGNLFEIIQQRPLAFDEKTSVIPLLAATNYSATLIQLREGVKSHFHTNHEELVYVLQGKGVMTVGDEKQVINAGDLIYLERNQVHSVVNKSPQPLVAISLMSPPFDGEDRHYVE